MREIGVVDEWNHVTFDSAQLKPRLECLIYKFLCSELKIKIFIIDWVCLNFKLTQSVIKILNLKFAKNEVLDSAWFFSGIY